MRITYAPCLPDGAIRSTSPKRQATGGATRPLCALMSAGVSLRQYDNPTAWGGGARGEFEDVDEAWKYLLTDAETEHDVPENRAMQWVYSQVDWSGTKYEFPTKLSDFEEWDAARKYVSSIEFPAGGDMTFTLDSYQLKAIERLAAGGGGVGMLMGLGKTAVATAAAIAYKFLGLDNDSDDDATPRRVYIVAPLNTFAAWDEVIHLLDEEFDEVQIVSSDSVHKLKGLANTGGVLIVDEMHYFGSESTRRTKAIHDLRRKFTVGIGLTGTALQGGPEKVLSMLDICIPGAAVFSNKWKFGEHFHCLAKKAVAGRTVTEVADIPSEGEKGFFAYMGKVIQVIDDKTDEVMVDVKMVDQFKDFVEVAQPWKPHTQLVTEIIDRELAETGEIPHMSAIAHELARYGAEHKIDWFFDNFDPTEHEPVVVFANYRATMDAFEAAATERGIGIFRIDGDTKKVERKSIVKLFNTGERDIVLLQMKAGSVGINLQRAALSMSLDTSWSAADYTQALARTRRRTQTRECLHIDLIANRFQRAVVTKLRSREDFNSKCAEWQSGKAIVDAVKAVVA